MKTDVQISDVMLTFAGGMYQHVREHIHTLRTAKSIHMRYCPVRPIGNFLCRDLGQIIAEESWLPTGVFGHVHWIQSFP